MQYTLTNIQQDGESLNVALSLYLQADFDYTQAKAQAVQADAQVSDLQNQIANVIALGEQVRQQHISLLALQKTLVAQQQTAAAALIPDKTINVTYPMTEFESILSNPELDAGQKIQAMVATKRAEIEAQLKAQAELLLLQKQAVAQLIDTPTIIT